MWKFCGKAHSPEKATCPKLWGNYAFPQNFHTRKLGENCGIFHSGWVMRFILKTSSNSKMLCIGNYTLFSPFFLFLWKSISQKFKLLVTQEINLVYLKLPKTLLFVEKKNMSTLKLKLLAKEVYTDLPHKIHPTLIICEIFNQKRFL